MLISVRVNLVLAHVALVGLSCVVAGQAQQKSGANAVAARGGETARIAIIYTADFEDARAGIGSMNRALESLTREFAGRQTDLRDMKQLHALEAELAGISDSASPAVMDKLQELNRLKVNRQAQDTEIAYERRRQEILAPVYAAIQGSLVDYARSHKVEIIIDGSAVPVAYAADAVNITRAFIKDFNAKNPPAVGTP